MENLKIRVNSEAESKEVQDFAKSDGYSRKYNNFTLHKGWVCLNSEKDILCVCHSQSGNELDDYKEITLPELRDLVVLKRNDVGDATHESPCGELKFILLGDWWNLFTGGKWQQFSHKQSPRCNKLKPIEKPMKEYLRKNNDGEYILEVTDEREAQEPHAKHWIEVPKGCDYLISVFGVNSFIDSDMFAKFKTKNVLWSRKPMKEYLNKETYAYVKTHDLVSKDSNWIEIPEGAEIYLDPSCNVYGFYKDNFKQVWCETEWEDTVHNSANLQIWKNMPVLWQRHTLPEELPFIDDESSLGNSKIGRRAITVKIPVESLNDQYAEIETVRQSAWQKQEGGSHYKNLKIQPMQYALENKLDYAQANVVKYVTRHADKNGKEDLLKAIHNIELMIEFYYGDEK